MAKAFESVFGGVTCLPGCFSMYRLKARKANDSDWVPVLVQSEICREYSQAIVTTLHQKNLLLLGEDRFLTTSMIRTFPARKMMFCPQAVCRTVAPDTFRVLLSQRRRWINSTVHNLMELVRVPNLCGTFCFSMQFVVFMELIGTVVLPVAIVRAPNPADRADSTVPHLHAHHQLRVQPAQRLLRRHPSAAPRRRHRSAGHPHPPHDPQGHLPELDARLLDRSACLVRPRPFEHR